MTHERILRLDGAFNFRDLGGYPTIDGHETKWGRIFRSDTLHAITPEDLVRLHSLDIRSVIDLRSPGEIAYTGRGLIDASSIALIEVGTLQLDPSHDYAAVSTLDDVYWQYLTSGSEKFIRALQELGRPENYPVVVSCFFGKDRTGVLAALVLACAGVERHAIIEDYFLSTTRMDIIIERLRVDPVYADTLDRTPQWRLGASPDTMASFLERLDENFGGARSWALRAGLTQVQLDNLRRAMLE